MASATRSAASVLPDAVGPTRARNGSTPQTSSGRRHDLAGEVVRRGVGDASRDERPRLECSLQVDDPVRAGPRLRDDAPRRPAPSTSTSASVPICARAFSSEISSWRATSRSNRSCTTSFGTGRASRRPGYPVSGSTGTCRPNRTARADHIERVGEVLLGLAREPDDDVGRHGDVRDRVADPIEPPQVALAPVGTLHRLQDARPTPTAAGSGCARRPSRSRPSPRSRPA